MEGLAKSGCVRAVLFQRSPVFTPTDIADLTKGGVAKSGWQTTRRTRTSSWKRKSSKVGRDIDNEDGTVDDCHDPTSCLLFSPKVPVLPLISHPGLPHFLWSSLKCSLE